jgi:AraC-like DNA-binding protein
MSVIQSRFIPVPDVLRRDIECIRTFDHTGDIGASINVAAGGAPGITFHHAAGRPAIDHISIAGREIVMPTLFLYGPGTAPSVMHYTGGHHRTVLIVLKPHALNTVFGLNAAALAGTNVDVREFTHEDINGQLMDARDAGVQAGLLTTFLIAQLDAQRAGRDPLVEEALRLIDTFTASVTVKGLLERLSLSERQFERRFLQSVGITPQSYIRIKRFQEALRCISTGQHRRLTDIAHALNYYDQSHFIRDIKAFSGMTPKGLLQIENIDHHPQAGTSWPES